MKLKLIRTSGAIAGLGQTSAKIEHRIFLRSRSRRLGVYKSENMLRDMLKD